ncbi:MAG: Abi family protein [Pseudomonadales bacterium]|nr:Abi family protein [Pseudomonadales bacterium]
MAIVPKIPYAKPASSIQDQLLKLTSRGLAIPDPTLAEHFLKFVGYYRLIGYGLGFYDRATKCYVAGKSFQDLVDHYTLDRELRVLIMDEIERVEIAVRSCIVNYLSLTYGPHWHLNQGVFVTTFDFAKFSRTVATEVGRSREPFIYHYNRK